MPFLAALLICAGATPLAALVGRRVGLVDRAADPSLAIHTRPVPVLGGAAVIASAFVAAALVGRGAPWAVIAAVAIAFMAGVVDDVRPLSPISRVAVLAVAGTVLAAPGHELSVFGVLARPSIVLLVVASANAVNLVDGQNGLAAGLTAIAALGFAGIGAGSFNALALAFAGAALGFVIWNLRGVVFLGNGGAYGVGVALAALASHTATQHGWRGVVAAGLCLAIFGFELLFTIVRRLAVGAPLTGGDRSHTYDLVSAKIGRTASTAAFCVAGTAIAGIAVGLTRVSLLISLTIIATMALAAAARGRRLLMGVFRSIFRRSVHGKLAVLAYHSVDDEDSLARHLDFIARNCRPVSMQDVLDAINGSAQLPDGAVLVTFDDADATVLNKARPLLVERGIPAVAFVIASLLDTNKQLWTKEARDLVRSGGSASDVEGLDADLAVRRMKQMPDERRLATLEELRRTAGGPASPAAQLRAGDLRVLRSSGIEIGNHTMTHPCLDRCSEERIAEEITAAHRVLTSAGVEPRALAYPNGNMDRRVTDIVGALGYEAAFLFDHRLNGEKINDRLAISRLRVNSTDSLDRFRAVVTGLHPAFMALRERARRPTVDLSS